MPDIIYSNIVTYERVGAGSFTIPLPASYSSYFSYMLEIRIFLTHALLHN